MNSTQMDLYWKRYYDEIVVMTSSDENEEQSPQYEEKKLKKMTSDQATQIMSTKRDDTSDGGGMKRRESFDSESDVSKSDEIKDTDNMITAAKWENLDVPIEIKDCFQDVLKYTPQNVEIEYHLQPFIPDYVPAAGDVDAFLKTSCTDIIGQTKKAQSITELIQTLGLKVLDEPSGQQSEPSLLHMKLRSVLTSASNTTVTPIISRSQRDIDKWIAEIKQLHISQFTKPSNLSQNAPDIDNLMVEWPTMFEQTFSKVGFPPANLDCSLKFYVEMISAIFDIPLVGHKQSDYIIALQTLFNLYLAVNNSFE